MHQLKNARDDEKRAKKHGAGHCHRNGVDPCKSPKDDAGDTQQDEKKPSIIEGRGHDGVSSSKYERISLMLREITQRVC